MNITHLTKSSYWMSTLASYSPGQVVCVSQVSGLCPRGWQYITQIGKDIHIIM